jgi:thymidylate synthase (FAD)
MGQVSLVVELVALTKFLKSKAGLPEELIEYASRKCYRSMPQGGERAMRYVMARVSEGHGSVIEHAHATFDISGISRACSHQLVRHRIASYSQESQRYVDMSDPDYVVPKMIINSDEDLALFEETIGECLAGYRVLRKSGIRKEDARFLLPNAIATTLVVTMNFRSLRHFFKVRCQKDAQWEIRELALEMLRQIYPHAPGTFKDLYEEFVERAE